MRWVALIPVVALALAAPAAGAWSAGAAGSGAVAARTMPAGNTPSGTAGLNSVSLSWAASTFAGGEPVPGYVVKRINSITQEATPGVAACAGVVTATSCVESGVPAGSWKYTIAPAAGTWRGAESAESATVVVL